MTDTAAARSRRIFASSADEPRCRRATDLVLLLTALAGLIALVLAYPPGAFERSLEGFLEDFPGWLDAAWEFLYGLVAVWAAVLLLVTASSRRWFAFLQTCAALLLGVAAALIAARLAIGSWPDVADALRGSSGAPAFPAMRLAEAAVVILTVNGHLVRPLQTVGRWIVFLGLVSALFVDAATPSGTVAAILIAVVAAAAVRLALGTSAGRLGIAEVAAVLSRHGVDARRLELVDRQPAGVVLLRAQDEEGRPLLVKVHGRDAYDNQLVSKLWRAIWYEDSGLVRLGRRELAEHEALVSLLAAKSGVPTRDVVAVGSTPDDDALLVLRGSAEPIDSVPAESIDDVLLEDCWRTLGRLHEAAIAHRAINGSTLVSVDGRAGLVDFARAGTSPRTTELEIDRAQLLATCAGRVGSEPAVAAAIRALGTDGVMSLLPYLQPAALGTELARSLMSAGLDLDQLRADAAAAAAGEPPELAKLRRFTWASALQLALILLAASAIFSAVVNIDWAEVRSNLSDAAWGWIVFGFIVAQLPRLTQAVATLGSVAVRLPFGPVYVMQLATCYMNLAVPSSLARLSVNIRFFQRQGLPPTAAVMSGAIDGFAGNVVQATLLVLILLLTELTLSVDLNAPSGGDLTLVWILLAVVVVSVAVVLLVPRLRRAIVGKVRAALPHIRAAIGGLRASNKLAQLVLGNVATEVLFATALGLFARGLGYHIPLTTLLLINVSVSLLSSLVPVPGGIGVTEYGLTIGLTSAGMTNEAALCAVLLYRLATFYLPPIWGFFALRWLERNHYL